MSAPRSVTVIEVDVPHCALTYGAAPCEAALGVTGDRKCFNTLKTCQDRANFSDDPRTLRFAMSALYLPQWLDAIPSVESVQFDPGTISLGDDLGQRASLTVTFNDHPWSDTWGHDPYPADRNYAPYERGSFWPKFRARHPFVQGRALRWYDGHADQTLEEMTCRHFVIESFSLDANGRYSLVAKDILKLFDDDRAQAPRPSGGKVAAGIDHDDTSLTLQPTGIGANYPASGYATIGGKEVVAFTRSGDTLSLTRARFNTSAIDHASGADVQVGLFIDAMDPADIIALLAEDYADTDPAFIPIEAWQQETDAHFRRLLTRFIAFPTGVRSLVSSLCKQAGLKLWWDDESQLIQLQVLRAIATDAELFSPASYRPDTFTVKEQPDKRFTDIQVFYGQKNPLEGDTPDNYRVSEHVVNTEALEDHGTRRFEQIFGNWIPFGGSSIALRCAEMRLSQFRDPPRLMTMEVPRYAEATPTLGEGCQVQAQVLQDDTGAPATVPGQIVRLRATPGHWEVTVEESRYTSSSEDLSNRVISVNAPFRNLNLRALHDATYPDPVGGETVTFRIEAWVTIGSNSTSTAAIDTGTWPSVSFTGTRSNGSPTLTSIADTSAFAAGMAVTGTGIPNNTRVVSKTSNSVTLDKNVTASGTTSLTLWTVIVNVVHEGVARGRGGNGGRGANPTNDSPATNGGAGGPAFRVRVPINLTDTNGVLAGGGGGGGGSGCRNPNDHGGAGGGGGAGDSGGSGGAATGTIPSPSRQNGKAGTITSGGQGGEAYTNTSWFALPSYSGVRAGNGGNPGQAGGAGDSTPDLARGLGGAAGRSIDGISLVKTIGSAGTRTGPTGG